METAPELGGRSHWQPQRRPWGAGDALALLAWTAAIALYFWDAVTLQRALFYFDITEINFPYRDFFARELCAGRFSRWCPDLYCGLPLYSESQAGYLHPLKYLLYPWLAAWKAFNLDTILSVWITGLGAYGWLRRHVGAAGALAGAGVFGLGGFVWAHLIHTSMINALASVPLVVWALESAWERTRLWPLVLGALALACQVFAGHGQDTLLTSALVGLYGLYRAATEPALRGRLLALGMAVGLVGLGALVSAVQWIPSTELLARSPRAGGLTWDDATFGSWHPELLPTLVVREAYGTRARDTDWMDGYYPYHEMNAYLGVIALGLAIVGAGAYRDRWVAFWIVLTGVAGLLMLGRFTFLLDHATVIPVFGSSRIPVRYHLWASLAIAALAAVGVDRLARPGAVRLWPAVTAMAALVVAAILVAAYVYEPAWKDAALWSSPYHQARSGWLVGELSWASARTALLVLAALAAARSAARTAVPETRRRLAAVLPVLILVDLLGAHWADVPTVAPSYWTNPPASARLLASDPAFVRLFGISDFHAGEPGFASEPVDFLAVRDTLNWSLPVVWGLASARGETPIIPRRMLEYTDHVLRGGGRFDVEAVSHVVAGPNFASTWGPGAPAGTAFVYRNPSALPRARLMGLPEYADSETAAIAALDRLGSKVRDRLVVEDPNRPLPRDRPAAGSAAITIDLPERVEVRTESAGEAYLVLADTFDPGWSATVDGRPAPIRPAFVAFRAVFVPAGRHTVVFKYRPAGFTAGLAISGGGVAVALVFLRWPRRAASLVPEHGHAKWPRRWPLVGLAVIILIVAASVVRVERSGHVSTQSRWRGSLHRFTWGAAVSPRRSRPAQF